MISRWKHSRSILTRRLVLALVFSAPMALHAAEMGTLFTTPEEAVTALVAAVTANDTNAVLTIFGPAATAIANPDPVLAANEFRAFGAAIKQTWRLVRMSESNSVLEVGDNHWPFSIPIMRQDARWFFDTEAGKEELLNRRIGRNELTTLAAMRAYVEAQREYAAKDHSGNEVLKFAQKLISDPGAKDGLYWPPELDGEISPLGPLVAQAQNDGYAVKAKEQGAAPEPFHGYYFRILTRQGKSAPGGEYDYIINGNMIGGFALLAWPSNYGETGIMTFIVNQQGRVYQRNLGPATAKTAAGIQTYDPDKTWAVSPD